MHSLVLGQTGSGKTTLLKALMLNFRRSGIPCLAFTSISHDFKGYASEVYHDVDAFMCRVFATSRCAVFVDESGEVTNTSKVRETAPLATRSRHLGHAVHFSAQRAQGLVGPIVRDQCERLYLFRVGWDDAALLAKDWAPSPEALELIRGASSFEKGEHVFVQRYPSRVERRQLDFAAMYGSKV